MCWNEPKLGFGCAGRKKDGNFEKGDDKDDGLDNDDNNGDSKKGRKGGFLPFFGFFKKINKDKDPIDTGKRSNVDSVMT